MRVSHKKCNRAEELCMHQKERKILKTITILMQVLKDQRKKKQLERASNSTTAFKGLHQTMLYSRILRAKEGSPTKSSNKKPNTGETRSRTEVLHYVLAIYIKEKKHLTSTLGMLKKESTESQRSNKRTRLLLNACRNFMPTHG